ncbi:MAG: hypothetical protein K0R93_1064 [Anaerosolibacter sp.]|uniref:stalk domain-containing protein n=1 Tax=Anaerosolibacter sp. TaxID=1872527 RepID=UPI0026350964|nr:stalk domain-containing protein [Anaerosolibacter sp.]MDF2546166.1 hypothetical protein [Anaerosolibacter sp.]
MKRSVSWLLVLILVLASVTSGFALDLNTNQSVIAGEIISIPNVNDGETAWLAPEGATFSSLVEDGTTVTSAVYELGATEINIDVPTNVGEYKLYITDGSIILSEAAGILTATAPVAANQTVHIWVMDAVTDAALEGALVIFGNDISGYEELIAGVNGEVVIEAEYGVYELFVDKFGYESIEREVTVGESTNEQHITVSLNPVEVKDVTFRVLDGTTPVANAVVYIGNHGYTTDEFGEAALLLEYGDLGFDVVAEGYNDVNGIIPVTADTPEVVEVQMTKLIEGQYDVQAEFTIGSLKVRVTDENGSRIQTLSAPMLVKNGFAVIPARAFSEVYGFEVLWNADTKEMYLQKDGMEATFVHGSINFTFGPIDGEKQIFAADVAPYVLDGRSYLPIFDVIDKYPALKAIKNDPPAHTISLKFREADTQGNPTGNVIPGVSVIMDGHTIVTNAEGVATFVDVFGTPSYDESYITFTAIKSGYMTKTSEVLSNGTALFEIALVKSAPTSGSSGSSSGGSSGGGSTTPSTPALTPSLISDQVKTEGDKALNESLAKGQAATITLQNDKDNKAEVSATIITRLAEENKPILIQNKGVEIKFAPQSLVTPELKKALESKIGNLELGAKELTADETKDLIVKVTEGNTGLIEIGGKVFDLTAQIVSGTTVEKVKSFSEPVGITIDVSELKISEIAKLTGVRYVKNEDGSVKAVKLGGKYDAKNKTFTFFTDQFSLFGVMQAEELTKVELTIGQSDTIVNDTARYNDVAPVVMNNRTMVPVRFIVENLGGRVAWNETTKEISITLDGKELKMVINQPIEGFDANPTIVDNRTLVPLRYVSEALGANVLWFGESKRVEIVK